MEKNGIYAIKSDMGKAYDRLERILLENVLLISVFLTGGLIGYTVYYGTIFRLILNGRTACPFQPKLDIRQGYMLSPYIFNMCKISRTLYSFHIYAKRVRHKHKPKER